MKKQLAVFSWWLDSAAQCTTLLGITFAAALGWWLIALYLLFFLGVWQLGSGLLWGLVQHDRWRFIYVGAALAFVVIALFSLPVLDDILSTFLYKMVLGTIAATSYVAAWVFLWHTHHQRPGKQQDTTADFVPTLL